ncbi:MAG: hypothetical protein U0269_02400 [Polyangiales bacterium]
MTCARGAGERHLFVPVPDDSPDPSAPDELASEWVGVGPARADAVLPAVTFVRGTLRWTDRSITVAFADDEQGRSASSVEIARGDVVRGWFVPAFVERARGLAVAGQERPIVTTANFAPWLVLETRDQRWVAIATAERDRAYALLDALGVGPVHVSPVWEFFATDKARKLPFATTRARFRMAGTGALASTLVIDTLVAYAGAWLAVALVSVAGAALIVAGRSAFRQRISSLSVDATERRAAVQSRTIDELALDLRKLEGVRFTRSGVVIEYEDAPRPIVVDVLDRDESARAVEGEDAALSKLRMVHTFADWAARAKESPR